ncbi:MAG: VanW family protein [Eubacteriales bacterium]|nr:VanW family protein [Eubacteriales bacterium]
MKKWPAQLLIGTLCLCLALSGGTALGEEAQTAVSTVAPQTDEIMEDPAALAGEADMTAQSDYSAVRYTAVASTALKVRREPTADSAGNGSLDRNDVAYIIELGDEWSLVYTGRNVGYVLTKYLIDIKPYVYSSTGETDTASAAVAPAATSDASADSPDGFQEKFVAYAYKKVVARKEMDEKSAAVFRIPQYDEVTVSANQGGWSYIRYKNSYGYVPTDSLFKWDRIDPYAGDIPGCIKHMGLAFVNHSTDIRSYDDNGNEVLKTVNPGSALAVDTPDAQGRYPLPYWRTTGYVEESDIGYMMMVVPWEDAQSGDLISCMSTYYAVGIHTINYQGRNYNIYLGSSFISGTVVQPNETVNTYDLMGPYRYSTGYHRAPIMNPHALWGYGGGTCQVNTTLYNVLIQVPIFINWRKVHLEIGIYYCPVGFDAAVGGGDITMIFTNTLPYAIRINYFMSDGCLTVGIFRV